MSKVNRILVKSPVGDAVLSFPFKDTTIEFQYKNGDKICISVNLPMSEDIHIMKIGKHLSDNLVILPKISNVILIN